MLNYIALIQRSEFNALFKYGHLYVHNPIPFEGQLIEHSNDVALFQSLTRYMNISEYSTEYLELQFCKNPFVGTSVEVFIKDVTGLYAIDAEAHATLSVSIDPRINLQISCWSAFYNDLRKKQAVRQAKAGMFNCFEIFKIKDDDRSSIKQILTDAFIDGIYRDLYAGNRPSGNKSIWTYLIRYERHYPYWNDIRGFFSDAIHVFHNFLKKEEIDYEIADEVPLGEVVSKCSGDFKQIYQTIMQNDHSQYEVDSCNYLCVASLFLYMKSLFKDRGITMPKFNTYEPIFSDFYINYGFDFALAVGLLGIVLSQELTYNCYYELKNLNIFKKSNHADDVVVEEEKGLVDPKTNRQLNNLEAEDLLISLYKKIRNLEEKIDTLEGTKPITEHNESKGEIVSERNIEGNEKKSDNVIESKMNDIQQTLEISDDDHFKGHQSSDEDTSSSLYPVSMRKLTKDKKKFYQRRTSLLAQSKEEEINLRNQGYEREDFFDSSMFK